MTKYFLQRTNVVIYSENICKLCDKTKGVLNNQYALRNLVHTWCIGTYYPLVVGHDPILIERQFIFVVVDFVTNIDSLFNRINNQVNIIISFIFYCADIKTVFQHPFKFSWWVFCTCFGMLKTIII